MANKLENCKQLIRTLIRKCEPPEFALENYSRVTYNKAKHEVLMEHANKTL